MVRISDIFKKIKEKKEQEMSRRALPADTTPPKIPTEPALPQKAEPEAETAKLEETRAYPEAKEKIPEQAGLRISPIVKDVVKKANQDESQKLYFDLISQKKEILTQKQPINIEKIIPQIERVVDQLSLENQELLMLALIEDSFREEYFFSHAVNVCIYSIQMGIGLGYERSKLLELGCAAFLHDIGMVNYLSIVNNPRKLTPKEYEEVKRHTLMGKQVLENLGELGKISSLVAYEHHERIDGTGYPQGLLDEAISAYAKIVSIIDVYEAMTHLRRYRLSHPSLETVHEILNNKDKFDQRLIKILIERIGIYPVGSFVTLNTKEIAQVVKLNPAFPLRPVVKVIYGTEGQLLKETKIFDLSAQPAIYILRGIGKKIYNQKSTNNTD